MNRIVRRLLALIEFYRHARVCHVAGFTQTSMVALR